jgi:hypothetical protein
MSGVVTIETGYRPESSVPTAAERKVIIRNTVVLRRNLRRAFDERRDWLGAVRVLDTLIAEARRDADIGAMARLKRARAQIAEDAAALAETVAATAARLMDTMTLLDGVATLHEKAALFGFSDVLADRAAAEVGIDGIWAVYSFLPEDRREDAIFVPLTIEMIRRISAHPIADRMVTQELNAILGDYAFPLPPRPRPRPTSVREVPHA